MGVIIVEFPEQMDGLLTDKIAIVGVVLTDTVATAVFVEAQPVEFVPVKLYVVFVIGVTVNELPERFPGFKVYVEAPLGVSVTELPEQILAEDAVKLTVVAAVG